MSLKSIHKLLTNVNFYEISTELKNSMIIFVTYNLYYKVNEKNTDSQ